MELHNGARQFIDYFVFKTNVNLLGPMVSTGVAYMAKVVETEPRNRTYHVRGCSQHISR